ncbi:efflux RND transporter periplasmic adaptor subunit [Terrimonas rubra]|uniref:Efflux RND transporter periplasmic adaptor subunit n=1 Tax=Terrimonas rubra TaxID=1035890 RepID=A0ABW5ZYQ4_9BACT
MKNILTLTMALVTVLVFVACGGGKKEGKSALGDKKVELEKLKKEQSALNDKIGKLEDEIAKLDPTAANANAKLVSVSTIGTDSFSHFVDLQGKVDAVNVAMVAPRGQGGVVRAVNVKQGQAVSKGQLILRLDNALASQQLAAAETQIAGIEAQVKLAQSVYERQQNLWKNNIGTEVQVLQAKTNAENAAAQLSAAKANVQLAREAAGQANVYAEMSGVVDVVNVKVGEFFSPQSAAMPQTGIRIVNTGDLKVAVQVPENYITNVKEGAAIRVTFPELDNKVVTTKISVVSKLVDPVSRTFFIEARLPQDKALKANQIAKVQILDYTNNAAITIPLNTLQTDDKGKFVLVAANENGKLIARKKEIQIGKLYGDQIEVKAGLAQGDQIITDGFQNVYDGQAITLSK